MLKRLGSITLIFVLSAFVLIGCGGDKNDAPPEANGKEAFAPTGDEGSISGTISFQGEAPAPRRIDMSADPNCLTAGGSLFAEDLVVNDGKLANVYVYVSGGPLDNFTFTTPSEPGHLDQKGCHYIPHVLGLQTGQTLRVTNSDATMHNVNVQPVHNRGFNQSQAQNAPAIERVFARAEVLIPVKCNQHPWMKASIGVLAHPYFAVTGEDGSYDLKGLPPGEYTVSAWHETQGEQSAKVTVAARDSKTQDFTFEANRAYGPSRLRMEPALVLP